MVEQSEAGDRFGDTEKGWKNRLIIPSPTAQPRESETDIAQAASTVIPAGRDEDFKPVAPQELEHPLPEGLPPDITPEEFAAIAAAAAAFGKPEEPIARPEAVAEAEPVESARAASDGSSSTAPAATFASAPEAEAETVVEPEPPAAEVQPAPATVASSEAAKTNGSPAAME